MKTNVTRRSEPGSDGSFRLALEAELARRSTANPQYSLRAFALDLGTDHSSLGQILRGKRRLTEVVIRRLGARLGLAEDELAELVAAERLLEAERTQAARAVQELAGATAALVAEWQHYAILELVKLEGFRADSRWVAETLGLSVDEVNLALHRLLHLGLLEMHGARWVDRTGDSCASFEELGEAAIEAPAGELRGLVARSFASVPAAHREHSSTTLAVRAERLPAAIERTASFYVELFDRRIDTDNALGYRHVDTGSERGIQGGIWPAPPGAAGLVQLFVEVEDVGDAVRRAERLGARTLFPPQKLPDGDEMALLLDPLGMSFGVWRSAG